MLNANPIPFYAGWDEGVRQFVVTNRLLYSKRSRLFYEFLNKSSGYSATSIVDALKRLFGNLKTRDLQNLLYKE